MAAKKIWTVKHAQFLSRDMYNKLYRLNFRSSSPMQKALSRCRNGEHKHFVIVYSFGSSVLGWALLWEESILRLNCYFYVRKSHRRKGIGTKLSKKAASIAKAQFRRKEFIVWAHDEQAKEFFESLDDVLVES